MRNLLVLPALLLAFAALVPAASAASRCTLVEPGITKHVPVGDTGRSMLIHMPADYRPGTRLPLLFVLHGSGGDGATILKQSGLVATSDRHGFLLAAPDGGIPVGKGFVWNIPGVPTVTGKVPGPDDADDVVFIRAAIDWLAAQGCADSSRVYASGWSGGGRLTSWLGCVASDKIAAIAPVVGLRAGNPLKGDPKRPDPATCRPAKPVPVIAFAGDKDGTNPVQGGGAGYWQYTMDAALARWAELGACRAGPLRRDLAIDLYEQLYTACSARTEVIGHIKRGAGHVWTADNEAMWAFLSRYRRR